MRKHMTEETLMTWAREDSGSIVIRTYIDGTSYDEKRATTGSEQVLLQGILFGALLGLNWGERNRSSSEAAQSIKDATEFIAMQLLPDGTNCYDTVYCRLWKRLDNWPMEA